MWLEMGCSFRQGPFGQVKIKCKAKSPHRGTHWIGGPAPFHRSTDDDKLWVWNFRRQKWERVDKRDYHQGNFHWGEWDHKHTRDRSGRPFSYSDAADYYGLTR